MMISINDLLLLLLYVALLILVIIFIILGIKLIKTLKKVNIVIDDVTDKMNRVDGVFDIIDKTTSYATTISDKIISSITHFINVLFKKKKGTDENE